MALDDAAAAAAAAAAAVWEVLADEEAFANLPYGAIFEAVVHHKQRPSLSLPHLPLDAVALMRSCWQHAAHDRPSMEAVVRCLNVMIEARCAGTQYPAALGDAAPEGMGQVAHEELVGNLW
jgi:hypothetical protein